MAKVNSERFLELLSRSGLVTEDQYESALAEIRKAHGGEVPSDPATLADWLIDADLITRWQANNLLDGKHKGFMLGKYKLMRHLGTGGMSSVYLAENTKMRNRVAIKVLPRNKVEDSSYLARFKLEARAAAALNHNNIVRAIDIDQDGKTHYFVMEFVEGTNLQAKFKEEGPAPYEMAADFIAQAADGLQHAHDAGLVHRDIKPANLLVDGDNTVKILDMGLAKFTSDDQPSLTIAHDENVLGTADYLAPEQAINSHGVDYRADIYSLGCTLYYMLTGHPPFSEGTLPQRLMKHQTEQPPSIFEDRPDAPESLVNICSRMMVKSPDGRYQTAADVAAELRAWLADPQKVVAAAGVSSAGGTVRGEGARKELRTRKSSLPPPVPRTRPPVPRHGDTVSSSDSDTFTGGSSRRNEGFPDIRTSDSASGTDSGSRRQRATPPKRPASASVSESSGDFVFDPSALGSKSSSGPSIMQERAERRRKSETPIWLWALIGGGVIAVVTLLVMVLTR